MTYTTGDEFLTLCDHLGSRLEGENMESNLINACICYICSSNIDNLVNCWQKLHKDDQQDSSNTLQVRFIL